MAKAVTTPTKVERAPYAWDALWPLKIWPPIVVITGGIGTGKSTLALSTGAPPERTLTIDYEKSQEAFAAQLPGLRYVDMNQRLTGAGREYIPLNIYTETLTVLKDVQPGQYDVLILDNASDLEDGHAAYADKNPAAIGLSANQMGRSGGLRWGAIKKLYQHNLSSWSSKFKMVVIIVHLRDKWSGDSVVKDAFGKAVQEPKGKDTLELLSSLFLWLEPGSGGIPSANVVKCRIDKKVYVEDPDNPPEGLSLDAVKALNGEPGLLTIPVLPLRLPKATWTAIREYMRHPADLFNPAQGESVSAKALGEDDRLKLRALISQNDATAATANAGKAEQDAARAAEAALAAAKTKLAAEAVKLGLKTDQGRMDVAAVQAILEPAGFWPFQADHLEAALSLLRAKSANEQPA